MWGVSGERRGTPDTEEDMGPPKRRSVLQEGLCCLVRLSLPRLYWMDGRKRHSSSDPQSLSS